MSQKDEKAEDQFVTVTSSGSVSVDLGGFLKSTAGQKQLHQIRELRDFTRADAGGAAPAPASESKKA